MLGLFKVAKLTSCVLAALGASSAALGEDPKVFVFFPEAGQSKRFKATVSNNYLQTPLILKGVMRVVELHPDRMIMEYEAQSISISGITLTAGDPRAAESFIGIVVNYEADTDGSPLRLTNRDQVLESFRAIEDIPEDAHAFFSGLPDEMLASIVLRVPTYASICQDVDFSNGNVVQYEIDDSSSNGITQMGTVTYSLSNTNAETGVANIKYSEELSISASGQTAAKSTTADCNVSMNDGWTHSVIYSLDRRSGVQRKFESWEIEFN